MLNPMKLTVSLLTLFLLPAATVLGAGDPALPGNHPLSASQAGDVLISELRCAACHSGLARRSLQDKAAPDLTNVGSRVSPDYLRRFLASPATAHPGTTMPDMLAGRSDAERRQIAEALTHFLIAQSKGTFAAERPNPNDREVGKTLFHSVGCVACHGPKDESLQMRPLADPEDDAEDLEDQPTQEFKPIAVPLEHVAAKYSAKSLSEFLFQPLRVRSSGRMPDLKLTPDESLAIASYLVAEQPDEQPAFVPDAALVSKGKEHFRDLNCAACHALPGMSAAPLVRSLKDADVTRGCLSKSVGPGPRFQLEQAQTDAIVAALRDPKPVDDDRTVVAKTMTAFRCIACHVRDDYGGVPEAYSSFFVGSEEKLGEDGRIPPPLTLLGAKLQPAWLKKVLFDGESVRPYMATRMPQYGEANLGDLPALLARLDVLESKAMNIPSSEARSEPERQREKLLRAGGRELLGDQGLNCVACHTFNGKAAPGSRGIDLVTTTQRLQPGWFNSYVRNPGAFRPRTVMPSAWPNGVAAHQTILDGDTDTQIEAIWYYLSLGTSAADPSGIRSVSTRLTVADQAVTYRGRSRVAGYRGIAVGLPGKLSYAFNAETGALSAIWRGDFINVNWSGQGSGDFHPASEATLLAQDVSFARLEDENAPWPLMPVMTKEARTNPDPLYPKNLGYQFRGYYLGDSSIPTFMYRFGDIEIEDRSAALVTDDRAVLKRGLLFKSPTQQTIWFRALTGEIVQESDHVYRSGRLRLTIPPSETKIRPLAQGAARSELLLRITIPEGQSTLEFSYEPLTR